jgi:carbamoyltransferase
LTASSFAWILPRLGRRSCLLSTPFEADFYENPYDEKSSSTKPPSSPDTRLVVGLNKYSHDTTLCAADARTGEILFALSKERLTRTKHDAGNVASLVEHCLEQLELDIDAIQTVVMNNHHHRILPLEADLQHLEWESNLRINEGAEDGYTDEENLLSHATRYELSHHLAHAYSAAAQAPFDRGLVVVMDGMGETYRTMLRGVLDNDLQYVSDFCFGLDSFQCIPSDLHDRAKNSFFDWREAESVYVFCKEDATIDLKPVFKRFTEEYTPPTLYNHGFENMDSVGALYSRASSHIFGDWNACGKVMGLAPWAEHRWIDNGKELKPVLHDKPILSGKLYDDSLHIDRTLLSGIPHIARFDPDMFQEDGSQKRRYDFDDYEEDGEGRLPLQVALDAIALAHRIQVDLETVCIDFVKHFKQTTSETNLCLAGGVALNSVLNGRLARELGFEQTFIPPYPGDDGIAVGCCAYGLFGNNALDSQRNNESLSVRPPVWKRPLSPYVGPDPSEREMKTAMEEAAPWLEVETVRDEDQRLRMMVDEVTSGGVIAWYRSRVSWSAW